MGFRALPVVVLACGGASAEPVVTQELKAYDVRGSTAAAIRRDMNAKRPPFPLLPEGPRFDGYATTDIEWRFGTQENESGCVITGVSVKMHVTLSLPDLVAGSAPAKVATKFQAFRDRLMLHEQGHVEIGLDAARQIEAAIAAMGPQASCDALAARANATAETLMDEAWARNRAYDRDTGHGATQGVRFP